MDGQSSSYWYYRANTSSFSGDPSSGDVLWSNVSQTSATSVNISHTTQDGVDVGIFLSLFTSGQTLIVQDQNDSTNFQKWTISSTPTDSSTFITVPVTLQSSGGTGYDEHPEQPPDHRRSLLSARRVWDEWGEVETLARLAAAARVAVLGRAGLREQRHEWSRRRARP
jgi:hypothetical protein